MDKDKIKNNFSKSAPTYDQYADIQKEMIAALLSNLSFAFQNILDVGCGTGFSTIEASKKFPEAKVTGIDIAPGMIKQASLGKRGNNNIDFMLGDGEEIPLEDSQFDLVISNASMQWMNCEKFFLEIARVLQPKGTFCFSTYGPATFCELKQAGFSVNNFLPKEKLYGLLSSCFDEISINKMIVKKKYQSIFDLFAYLKGIGARYSFGAKNKGLFTKSKIASLFPDFGRNICVTYEIYFGNCHGIKKQLYPLIGN
ncbi:malonyl-[acyl-carrier protein] O-methyltransferase BioC [candidate division WOR-1 bacterium RIFOXYC2_FULL_37_10]|uniref:Malonyl-[acyl-carrier protein] O-methyltransferase n=1 Tax=candidate division WOR-1 bacterium RIFOXYB2_FULL_37_13 TaxID=1802579 RepID=A0A1F4SWC7_UNCSA|nr:MAG: malonyl-[acyl-carrier protein] O-methyltransferase BioC [candidate division WOR-1 bacterium RIFOXYA2_FULL_37_7]OGC24732.1 MAG: malonyl-[acyl-carrier protein] O-methyltransferase BioC [candidate division WOR-1 bacterium RIFOXYB2_FULL_37_13]OGC34808.1 MAG: malonyl-[acyl-carrier protein] O-methyltransferase BioC [candidate division WOR-1 bacterium RIFOXYC2_FULL_37_10]